MSEQVRWGTLIWATYGEVLSSSSCSFLCPKGHLLFLNSCFVGKRTTVWWWINHRTVTSRVQRSGLPLVSWALNGNNQKKTQIQEKQWKKCPVVQLHSCQLYFCIPAVLSVSHIFLSTYLWINLFCLQAKGWVSRKENSCLLTPWRRILSELWLLTDQEQNPTGSVYMRCITFVQQAQGSHKGRPLQYLLKCCFFSICLLLLKGSHRYTF